MIDTVRFDVTTLGEALLRLSVPAGERLELASAFQVYAGGAECNVVTALARLGRRCAWLGALPATPLGRLATNHLRLAGVDLEGAIWCSSGRIGTYYVEYAEAPRPIQVFYDRSDSCAAAVQPEDIDWSYLLNTRLLYLTGITPALSASCRLVVREAIRRARAAGVAVAFDVNYRQRLWSASAAAETLGELIREVDLLFCGQADAELLFGCVGSPEEKLRQLHERSAAAQIVMSLGDLGVIAWNGEQAVRAEARSLQVVDRIGAGDALAAGVIDGWLALRAAGGSARLSPRELHAGVTLAALALTQNGDAVVTTRDELDALVGDSGGTLIR